MVKNIQDAISIEKSHGYRGLYHVLGGLISPLQGIDEDASTIQTLMDRLRDGVEEVIFALEQTPEAEATIGVVKRRIRSTTAASVDLRMSRMAMGIPMGAELEYLDAMTLKSSLDNRLGLH